MANSTPNSVATTSTSSASGSGSVTGKTTVVDPVVAKLAGIAAREVTGVHALGGGAARVVGNIRDAIGQTDLGQGVRVEVGEKQVAADVTIVVDYPEKLQDVAEAVRTSVARVITQLVGMEVAEINVTVSDVYIPGDDNNNDDNNTNTQESRVA